MITNLPPTAQLNLLLRRHEEGPSRLQGQLSLLTAYRGVWKVQPELGFGAFIVMNPAGAVTNTFLHYQESPIILLRAAQGPMIFSQSFTGSLDSVFNVFRNIIRFESVISFFGNDHKRYFAGKKDRSTRQLNF